MIRCKVCTVEKAETEFYHGKRTCKRCCIISRTMEYHGISREAAEAKHEATQAKRALKDRGLWECNKCGQVKPIPEFYQYKDGTLSYCLVCPTDYTRSMHQKYRAEDWTGGTYRNCKTRSKRLGVPFDLDGEYLRSLFEEQGGECKLTGLAMTTDGVKGPYTASVDRIVPEKGYTKGNVRWVCWAVNAGLGDWGEADFARVASAYCARHQFTLNRAVRSR